MILVALAIGAILIVSALRDTYGALFTALGQDVPGYVLWAAAIVGLGALGYVPGLRGISRGLLVLVLIVLILNNGTAIFQGFTASASSSASSGAGSTTSGATATAPAATSSSSTAPEGNLTLGTLDGTQSITGSGALQNEIAPPDTATSFGASSTQ